MNPYDILITVSFPILPSDCQSSWQVAAQQDAHGKREADWQRAGLEAQLLYQPIWGGSINRGTPTIGWFIFWKLR